METVTNAATAAANTVQRAIFGSRAARDGSIARDDNPHHIGRSTAGASTVTDEPHQSRETATDSSPFRHSTGTPEHVTSSPYIQHDKGELSTGPTVYNTNSSAFSEDLPKATDHNPNNPLTSNTDNVSSPGGKDALKVHHGELGNRSTPGGTGSGSYGTRNHSASLGKTELGNTWLSNQPSGGLGKPELGKMESRNDDHSTGGTSLGKTEHSSADLGKAEGKTEFGKTEFAKSAQGKTELGNFSDYSTNSDRDANTSDPLAGDHGRKEPGPGHGAGIPHTSDLNTSSKLGSGVISKPSSTNETAGQSHISQPSAAASTTNEAPRAVAGVIGRGTGAVVEPSAGTQPTHKQQGTDKPLEEPSSSGDCSGAAASNTGGLKPLGRGMKHDNESHGEGTGEKYERSTGLAADGGDFDATRPGAGREADRLLEEQGIHRAARGSTNLEEERAKKSLHDKAPGESQGSGSEHKGLTTKIKEKLHLGHH
ncbi:hypothetical protein HOY80DRAFT_217511 [Tuber brumale]|nr:hypothetical protein HOY80DRAFT_217511 [Tuber brumale]